MSVINDMLKDLERRHNSQDQPQGSGGLEGLQSAAAADHRGPLRWLLPGLVLLTLLAWLVWSHFTQTTAISRAAPEPVEPPAEIKSSMNISESTLSVESDPVKEPGYEQVPEPGPEHAPPITNPPPPAPAVERIEVLGGENTTMVELEFNQPLSVPPQHYRRGDQLWLRLFPADASRIELPELPGDSPIKSWQGFLEEGYQMIRLQLADATRVELFQLRPAHWRLSLQPQIANVEKSTEPTAGTAQTATVDSGAREIEPGQPPASVKATPPPPVVKRSRGRYRAAQAAWTKGNRKSAEKHLKGVLASEPGHLQASQLLGRLYLEDERPALAEQVILSALQHHPAEPELVTYFTRGLLGQGRLQDAADYLSRAMQKGNAAHLGLMAAIRQQESDHAEASRFYWQALRLKPGEVTWLAGLGISQEHLGNVESARQVYQRALASGKLRQPLQGFVQERLRQLNK